MNAPLRKSDAASASGTLYLFALFHLNLAFSSIEEEQRGEVIARCYWPLLRLAAAHGPIGIEASGFTLEEIAARDPAWIVELKRLMTSGHVEFIGAGYAQLIGPLVPAQVNAANLRLGQRVYETLLGTQPTLALVNEQAYAAGLVPIYRAAGYRAILMDWDNPGAHHPEWPEDTRHLPQIACGTDGSEIGLIWTNTVAFQKLQRVAHGDIDEGAYLSWLNQQRAAQDRALCLYASDAEIFDFRPGRYKTEEAQSDQEWPRLAAIFAALQALPQMRLCLPSCVLELTPPETKQKLRLESPECPVPVKKQRKYNLSRWAVTGRDDIAINAACQRIYERLATNDAPDEAWKTLCYLWSSDFRTHITERRWTAYCQQLRAMEAAWCGDQQACEQPASCVPIAMRHIAVTTPAIRANLDRRRGLALQSVHFAGHASAAVGGLAHGHFDDIALQADWYTGDCVFEAPGEHKVTDLEWAETTLGQDGEDQIVDGRINTARGLIEKRLRICGTRPRIEFDLTFHWPDWGRGVLRLGHITLLPDAFDWHALTLTTHNGGHAAETFALAGHSIEHGAPVSFLVSASQGLGLTEGWAELGDQRTRLRVTVDRGCAPLLGLLTHRRAGGSLFCQLMLSALELDETRKPSAYHEGPRRFRFAIEAA